MPMTLPQSSLLVNFRSTEYSKRARERRYRKIAQLVGLRKDDRILDVGCGAGRSFEMFNHENEIVGLDIDPTQQISQENFRFVAGDAARMNCFQDGEFDVVVSIGVLERITPFENLRRAAAEIRRVGRAYAVVVPHMFTFIEPHSRLPLWQFSPSNFRTFSRRWDLMASAGNEAHLQNERLFYLRRREWHSLFPESTIASYCFMPAGLLWNFIIYRRQTYPLHPG